MSAQQNRNPAASPETRRSVPYYEQVANILRAEITSDETDQPVQLPSERELCAIHGVSRITISKALDLLQMEGLVRPNRGQGTLTVPEAIAQWKRLRQSRVIQIVADRRDVIENPATYYGQIYQGIWHRAEQAGYRLVVQRFARRAIIESSLQLPDVKTILGVICVGLMNEPSIRVYTQADYPVVSVDYWTTDPKADAIVSDCYCEGQDAVDFLLQHGHRDLFFVGNALSYGSETRPESDSELFLAGIQRARVLAGQPPIPPARICHSLFDPGSPRRLRDWFLGFRPRPTAGLIFNAGECENFVAHLKEAGVRCPEDVSLITKTAEGLTGHSEYTRLQAQASLIGDLAVTALIDRATGRRTTPLRMAVPSRLERGRTVRHIMA